MNNELVVAWKQQANNCEAEIARNKDSTDPLIMSDGDIACYEQAARTLRQCAEELDGNKRELNIHELLIVRHCKSNQVSYRTICRIIGDQFALDVEYVQEDPSLVFRVLLSLWQEFGLQWPKRMDLFELFTLVSPDKHIQPIKGIKTKERTTIWRDVVEEADGYYERPICFLVWQISMSRVARFSNYKSPSKYKNL